MNCSLFEAFHCLDLGFDLVAKTCDFSPLHVIVENSGKIVDET